jgi:hypothetical protein
LLLVSIPTALFSQAVSVSGRVLRGGRDTVPFANAWVVLHRLARDAAGPLDSMRSDARGRYRFTLRSPDSTSAYAVSVLYDSIAYFSLPLSVTGRPAAHVEDLIAFPTTSTGPPIRLTRRLVTVARATDDGTREVLEILELQNNGVATRVTTDTLAPTWAGRVPAGAGQFRGGQGDISSDAMQFRHDSVIVFAPIPPGPQKQISYGYSLPAGTRTLVIPIDQPTDEVNLLIEDTAAVVRAPKVESLGDKELEQRHFAAYRAGLLVPGDKVEIWLPGGKFRPQMLLPYVIALLAIAMVVALVWALRRRPPPPRLS